MLLLPIFAFALAGAFVVNADPLTAWVLRNAAYVTLLVIATTLVYHLYVVVDAFAGRMRRLRGRHLIDYAVLLLVMTYTRLRRPHPVVVRIVVAAVVLLPIALYAHDIASRTFLHQ